MDPFVLDLTYRLLICQSCCIAVFPKEVARHLKDHHEHLPKQRQEIAQKARQYQQIIQTPQQWAREGHWPPPEAPVIPSLAIYHDGLGCLTSNCHYTTRSSKAMKNHYHSQHDWVNPYPKGGSLANRRRHQYPWRTGVSCQRFFNHGAHQQYFAVTPAASTSSPAVALPSASAGPQQILHRIQEKQAEIASQTTVQADGKLDANPWLNRAGWARHLEGMRWEEMARLIAKPQEEEMTLQVMYEVFATVVRKAQEFVAGPWCPLHNRFELNRIKPGDDPTRPFEGRMEPDTLARYLQVWQRLIGYVYRTHQCADRRYSMLPSQQVPWDIFVGLVEGLDVDAVPETLHPPAPREQAHTPPVLTPLERAGLDVWLAWLDDPIGDGEYQNPLVSGLALLGYDARAETWASPLNYTSKLSAFIKLARLMVAMHASDRHRATPKDIQVSIRRQIRRFGTTEHPSPMYWVIMLRRYGLAIRHTTTAEGSIRWDGSVVSHGRTRLAMDDFRAGVHGLHNRCRQRLMRDLCCAERVVEVPAIPWDRLEDFPAEQQLGFSFLQDPRIPWPVSGDDWLFSRLVSEANPAHLLGRRAGGSQDLDARGWSRRHVRGYMRSIAQFKEELAILIHLTSGQPARATELLSIRYRNTAAGGTRNIFIEQRQVALVTAYHKGYQIQDSVKIIHRYLPQEVGELLIWYLWLVQPFQRQLEVAMQDTMCGSGYLWEAGLYDRPWIRERITRVMARETAQGMGVRLTVATYRQLAIAIARRYLQGAKFLDDDDRDEEDVADGIGDDEAGDHPLDLQAGHSTHIAGMIYARGVAEGMGHIESQRQQFRRISQAWHRFLQFPSAVEIGLVRRKRMLDQPDHAMQRWKRMRPVSVQSMLHQLVGAEGRFRGLQEPIVQAILAGVSPILAIMGTGSGKSLLFMLPALCAAQVSGPLLRVTIVVVPTVALRQDLFERCGTAGLICTQWDARKPQEHTSIMLVTLESAVTAGFQTYLHRLKAQQLLDRIVVDECHLILDCGQGFRDKVLRLPELWAMECQLVMLTATLPPRDEAEFFRLMQIPPEMVQIFRARTTRPNLRYSVVDAAGTPDEHDAAVVQVVHDCQLRHPLGKVVLYCMSKPHVRRLAELLQCPAYHHDVASQAGLVPLIRGPTCSVVVATNALGVGVDIPHIRAVIHVGGFRHLRDYGQESGRAGRDGEMSECIVIPRPRAGPSDAATAWSQGARCCRVVLDEYLDGDTSREGCREGEERCWVCCRADDPPNPLSPILDGSAVAVPHGLPTPTSSTHELRQHVQRQVQDEASAVAGFANAVQAWTDVCVLCRVRELACDHALADCPHPEPLVRTVQACVQEMLRCIRYAPYSACYDCGQPQWTCLRFSSNGAGGWVRAAEDLCEGHGVIVTVVVTAIIAVAPFGRPLLERMRQASVDPDSDAAVGRWLGRKIPWGGHEAARIHEVFWEFHQFWLHHQPPSQWEF